MRYTKPLVYTMSDEELSSISQRTRAVSIPADRIVAVEEITAPEIVAAAAVAVKSSHFETAAFWRYIGALECRGISGKTERREKEWYIVKTGNWLRDLNCCMTMTR